MKAIFVALVLVLLASGMCAAEETTIALSSYPNPLPDEKEYVWSLIGMFHKIATPIEWVLYV